jgi:hypothetical protein
VGRDDYVMGVEGVRDGRIHLMRTPGDLERWLVSFKQGQCEPAAFGICGVCDRIHCDRDDGEILRNCVRCSAELLSASLDP